MAGNYNKKKRSFFAEQRESNTNPNFINNMDHAFIRMNLKRILKDVSEDLIIDEDYIYFTNNNVINACIQESYEQAQIAITLRHALTAYRTIILPQGLVTPDVDINQDMALAAIELGKISEKENVWVIANKIFVDISNGYDPKSCLQYIQRFPKTAIKAL